MRSDILTLYVLNNGWYAKVCHSSFGYIGNKVYLVLSLVFDIYICTVYHLYFAASKFGDFKVDILA